MSYDASVDIYLTCRTIHDARYDNDNDNDNVNDNDNDARPGVWSSPDNILALYKAVQSFISQHSQKQNQNGEKNDGNGNIL